MTCGYAPNRLIPNFDKQMAYSWAKHLLDEGSCIEARVILKTQGRYGKSVLVGFFNSVEAVVDSTEQFNGTAQIYLGLNPRKIELLHAQFPNILVPHAEGGAGSDILEIRYLLIDVDSHKPSSKISASQEEIEGSGEVAEKIRAFLTLKGIPYYWGFSGNGWHIIVPVGPYRDISATSENFKRILIYLNQNFSDECGHVDLSTFDAPRVLRMYGSVAVKGANTTGRPWRRSYLNNLDTKICPVDILRLLDAEIKSVDTKRNFQRPKRAAGLDILPHFKRKSDVSP